MEEKIRDLLIALTEAVSSKETEKKTFYTAEDLMKRYDVGLARAQQIIREAKALHAYPGGKLGSGKLLPTELELWEHHLPSVTAPTGGYRR